MNTVKCPSCKKEALWANNPFRPFCSEKCKNHDLGKWANEEYRVPIEEMDGGLEIESEKKKEKKEGDS